MAMINAAHLDCLGARTPAPPPGWVVASITDLTEASSRGDESDTEDATSEVDIMTLLLCVKADAQKPPCMSCTRAAGGYATNQPSTRSIAFVAIAAFWSTGGKVNV